VQSKELAKNISPTGNITQIYKDETLQKDFPDLAIGVGFNVADSLISIKKNSNNKTKIAIILDPLKNYKDFDFIILPSYEPYKIKSDNILRTFGLINFVNKNYLKGKIFELENHPKYEFFKLLEAKSPYLAVVLGGYHTGGNITIKDAEKITNKINQIINEKGGTALITTSRRTEIQVTEFLKENLNVPFFLYDYKSRNTENPYGIFLALADEIMVTGDSVRMMSECCSAGKKVRIYVPDNLGFQYKPLIQELIENKFAKEFDSEIEKNTGTFINCL
jgi:mitochondrial fission protein ELM1